MEHKNTKQGNLLGVFDSGVGGFSVYSEITKKTSSPIVYVGDCAYAPYGNKKEEEIRARVKAILLFLIGQGVTYFVSACNSMSVLTTQELLDEVGVSRDAYCDMVDLVSCIPFTQEDRVLVVATKATIVSHVYQGVLDRKGVHVDVYTPVDLAYAIEQGDSEAIECEVTGVIEYAKNAKSTHVLYACTHYPLVHEVFVACAKVYGYQGIFVNPAEFLQENTLPQTAKFAEDVFVTTLDTQVFRNYTEGKRVLVCEI